MVVDEMDMNEREATSGVDDQPAEAPKGKLRRRLLTGIRYAVALGLIAFFLLRSDPREIFATFATINPVWLVGALAAMAGTLCLGAWRWKLLLSGLGHQVGFWPLLRLWLMGYFFDNFLPSNIGGDVARGYGLTRYRVPLAEVATSLVIGRLFGFFTLGVWGAIVLAVSAEIRSSAMLAAPNAVGAVVGLLGLAFLFWATMGKQLPEPSDQEVDAPGGLIDKVKRGARKLWRTCRSYRECPKVLVACFALSMGVWLVDTCILYCCIGGLGSALPYQHVIGLNTTLNWAGALPISVGGLGVQEGALSVLLQHFGIASAGGMAVGLAYRSVRWTTGLCGGLTLCFGDRAKKQAEVSVEEATEK